MVCLGELKIANHFLVYHTIHVCWLAGKSNTHLGSMSNAIFVAVLQAKLLALKSSVEYQVLFLLSYKIFGQISSNSFSISGISDNSFTSLPCNCPSHHVPVCARNGNTYPSACVARCTGIPDTDIEFGPCNNKSPCENVVCPGNGICVERRQVCLSVMHRPCQQFQCGKKIFNEEKCFFLPSKRFLNFKNHLNSKRDIQLSDTIRRRSL